MTLNEKELALFKKWLKGCLAFGPVTVTFTKKDGSERVMECTTSPSLVPVDLTEEKHYTNTDSPINFPAPKRERKVSEDVCPVYDLESKHWKSFRWDSIKQVRLEIK
jgi:WYL_2, Sm-like SH3 beta-barrel fold